MNPIYGVSFILDFEYRDAAGTIIQSPAGLTALISKDGAAAAASTNAPVCYDTARGLCSVTLTPAEMTANRITVIPLTTTPGALVVPVRLRTAAAELATKADLPTTESIPAGWVTLTETSTGLEPLDAAGVMVEAWSGGSVFNTAVSYQKGAVFGFDLPVPQGRTYTIRFHRVGFSYPERSVTT